MHCWKSCETLAIVNSERSRVLYTKQEGEMYLHWKAKKYSFQAVIFSAGPQRSSLVQDDHLASRAIFVRWPVMCNAKDPAAKRSVLLLCRETRQPVHRTCRECELVIVGVRLLRVLWHAGMRSLLLYSLYHNAFYVCCGRDDQGALPRMIGSDRSCACGRSAASRGNGRRL